jgi:hypothetical protein
MCIPGFGGETRGNGVSWSIIVKWILKEIGCGSTDWIFPAWDKGKWKALVNVVTHHGMWVIS